jgi:hypothetical protein
VEHRVVYLACLSGGQFLLLYGIIHVAFCSSTVSGLRSLAARKKTFFFIETDTTSYQNTVVTRLMIIIGSTKTIVNWNYR